MGRIYSVPFAQVTVTAAQDLISVKNSTSMVVKILACELTQSSTPAYAMQRVRYKRLTGTQSLDGTGGSAVTAHRHMTGDALASFTGRTNDTTQSIASSTYIIERAFNVSGAYIDSELPETVRYLGPGEKFVLDFPAIAVGSLAWNGHAVVEEIG